MIAKKFNGWLEKMLKAAGDVAKAVADNDGTKIGESVANGAGANANSVKGIATGMKGIIDAATESGVKFELAAVVNDNVDNKEAGKLFGTTAGADAGAGDVAKAAAAVGVVSGEQILKAIAAAAGTGKHGRGKGVMMLRMQFRLLLVVVRVVRILMNNKLGKEE